MLLTAPLYEELPNRLALAVRSREQGMLGDGGRGVGDYVVFLHVQLIRQL